MSETLDFEAILKLLGFWQLLRDGLYTFCMNGCAWAFVGPGAECYALCLHVPPKLLAVIGGVFSEVPKSRVCDLYSVQS